ncbi:uncharacterized protein LOC134539095 [Bacillus rossius redtenbacheri]|uniref:uncharacterized protein LOC134539095 n=1 Tax=Bacillus rossius redtenbacheri TaxID=93214 RepID=UPI002FDD1A21
MWAVLPAAMWAVLPAAMWALQPLRALPSALQPLLPALRHLGPAADRLHARHHGVHLQALLRQQLLLVLDVILAEIPTSRQHLNNIYTENLLELLTGVHID